MKLKVGLLSPEGLVSRPRSRLLGWMWVTGVRVRRPMSGVRCPESGAGSPMSGVRCPVGRKIAKSYHRPGRSSGERRIYSTGLGYGGSEVGAEDRGPISGVRCQMPGRLEDCNGYIDQGDHQGRGGSIPPTWVTGVGSRKPDARSAGRLQWHTIDQGDRQGRGGSIPLAKRCSA